MFVAQCRNTERGIAARKHIPQAPALTLVPKAEPVAEIAKPEPEPTVVGDDFALGVLIGLFLNRERQKVRMPGDKTRELIRQVADRHGVSLSDVMGPSRYKPIVEARFDAIVAVHRARPELSLPRIGAIFNKDHTSILHALRKRGIRYVPRWQAA